MKQEVRTLIETHAHEEDSLYRWLHGKNEWITKIIAAAFTIILCTVGVIFKEVRVGAVAFYCVFAFIRVLEWSRVPHLNTKAKDHHILACMIAIPGLLSVVLAGATDSNLHEGLALQAAGLIAFYAFSALKRQHDIAQSTQRPEA